MNRLGSDPKVKKTLVRNCEKKVKAPVSKQVVRDVGCSTKAGRSSQKENELGEPTLCSSEALANYLSDIKLSTSPVPKTDDLNVDKSKMNAKVNKKLNFHCNDRIYRNLIELNANIVDDLKKRNSKRPTSSSSLKKDLEPNIEDFIEETVDHDFPPQIQVVKPKFKMVKSVENGQLHKLVSAFENL